MVQMAIVHSHLCCCRDEMQVILLSSIEAQRVLLMLENYFGCEEVKEDRIHH